MSCKVRVEIDLRRHVRQLHAEYVEEFCRVCKNEGCHSDDMKNGTLTTEEVVEERIRKYSYKQTDEQIRNDYNCYKGL